LTIESSRRFQVIDVTRQIDASFGDLRRRHSRTLYCSLHTTAGYLERSLSTRLTHQRDQIDHFFRAFRNIFPPNAPYFHDQISLRNELTPEQKQVEPHNADSHLTFIGSGMRNCVTYRNQLGAPVFFIDLDGINEGRSRQRITPIIFYDQEQAVDRITMRVPVSKHPVDAVNLADPRLGMIEQINHSLRRAGISKGLVDITLDDGEREAGLTVNEYETLLMKHDLIDVLRDPLRFAALKTRHILDDPFSVPFKTLSYARYDVVCMLNSFLEAFGMSESILERLVAKMMAIPARHFLRSRKISFLASETCEGSGAQLLRGTYQSPILIQWDSAPGCIRKLDISIRALR
jgi:thiamine phosphate synthase YjbQ (UPF0047 family)